MAGGWWTGSSAQRPSSGVWPPLPASPCTLQLSHWASQPDRTPSRGHIKLTSPMEEGTSTLCLSLLTDHLGLCGQDMVGSSIIEHKHTMQCSETQIHGKAFAMLYLFLIQHLPPLISLRLASSLSVCISTFLSGADYDTSRESHDAR